MRETGNVRMQKGSTKVESEDTRKIEQGLTIGRKRKHLKHT
jgi:hypothetical protein